MKARLQGIIYRGEAVYYTFQRAATGLRYLDRQKTAGKDLRGFRVTYTLDGKPGERKAADFMSWASKLKEPVKIAKPSKTTTTKGKAKPKVKGSGNKSKASVKKTTVKKTSVVPGQASALPGTLQPN